MESIAFTDKVRVHTMLLQAQQIDVGSEHPQCPAERNEVVVIRIKEQSVELASSCQLQRITTDLRIYRLFTPIQRLTYTLGSTIRVEPRSGLLDLAHLPTASLDPKIRDLSRNREVGKLELARNPFVTLDEVKDEASICSTVKFCEPNSREEPSKCAKVQARIACKP